MITAYQSGLQVPDRRESVDTDLAQHGLGRPRVRLASRHVRRQSTSRLADPAGRRAPRPATRPADPRHRHRHWSGYAGHYPVAGPTTTVVGVDVSPQMLESLAISPIPGAATTCKPMPGSCRSRPPSSMLCSVSLPFPICPGLEWCRVGRPGAVRVFTTAAAEGILVHRLLRRAAEMHRLSLPDPHAALGTEDRIRAFVKALASP